MALPFFYMGQYTPGTLHLDLDENNSRHVIQVLRMKSGDSLHLTDGQGHLLVAEISRENKKNCGVRVRDVQFQKANSKPVTIAISLLKNPGRFEWFLEKCTEIGVTAFQPLICAHTEKSGFREERFQGILVSAMLQSQQVWLPRLFPALPFSRVVKESTENQKFIAHCSEEAKKELNEYLPCSGPQIMLIGPEGDFSAEEIRLAEASGFIPVSLGNTRLRTETAGMVAATLLKLG